MDAVKTLEIQVHKTVVAKKASATKNSTMKPSHPPTSEMVNAALGTLKDRKGSSLQAIKKYIADMYNIDIDKQSYLIRKYLKSAVAKEVIIQTKGTGASGRFKLATNKTENKKVKKPVGEQKVAKTMIMKNAKEGVTRSTNATTEVSTAKKSKVLKVKTSEKTPAATTKSPKPKITSPKLKATKK